MGKKSRHARNESDPLLGFYSQNLAASSSIRNTSNPLYSATDHGDLESNTGSLAAASLRFLSWGDSTSLSPVPKSPPTVQSPKDGSTTPRVDAHTPIRKSQKAKTSSKGTYRVHRVSYTAQNHVQVLFRVYGSAFPQVLPFALWNVLWSLIVHFLKTRNIVDLTFHSSIGHTFMSLLISFLVVARSQIAFQRFMSFRSHLATTYRTCRELAQLTTVYTFEKQSPEAKAWRQEVCFRTIVLLRVTMDALLWSSTEREQWEDEYYTYQRDTDSIGLEQFNFNETGDVEADIYGKSECNKVEGKSNQVSEHFFQFRGLTHGRRSNIDENFRAPITMGHVLRQVIMEHPSALGYKMPVNEYRDLVLLVGQFIEAFHSFRVLIFTPYPFSLMQMTRAFLFLWVYTLPLVLLKEYRLWPSIFIVVLVTIGFVGIEYVSMALDDPFADETNDVDEHGVSLAFRGSVDILSRQY